MKFFGKIGFMYNSSEPDEMGIVGEQIVERDYYGDVLQNTRRWENGESINDNLVINNRFSIVANDFAICNIGCMKYVVYHGVKWKITNVEINRPRIILTVGGVYNAP